MFVDKAIADRSKDYMNARRVAKEFEVVTRGLNRNAPAVPPYSTPEEIRQVDLWKKYISWEKTNPLKCEEMSLIIKRGLQCWPNLFQLFISKHFSQLFLPMNNVFYALVTTLIFGMNMLHILKKIAN